MINDEIIPDKHEGFLPKMETASESFKLIDVYYNQSKAIIEKAKEAERLLVPEETKKLRDLAIAIHELRFTLPIAEKRERTIVIRPENPFDDI